MATKQSQGFGKLIEEGSFSRVYKHIARDGRISAIKVFKKKKNRIGADLRMFKHEVKLMLSLGQHPFIVELLEQGVYKDNTLCIIMEFCAEGDLFSLMDRLGKHRFADSTRKAVIMQVTEALKFIHADNIIHNDIKLENILVKSYDARSGSIHCKLGDFGLASVGLVSHTVGGTVNYMAPEYCKHGYRMASSDIWALGLVSYYISFWKHPLIDQKQCGYKEIENKIVKYRDHSLFNHSLLCNSCEHLIDRMLTVDPLDRIAPDLILRHPYLKTD